MPLLPNLQMQHPFWKLDADSHTPLHRQFEQRIVDYIRAGAWKPGDRIPSERDLMLMADISRATVRQALGKLVNEGVLEKAHGRGTFVRPPKFEQPLHIVYSFYEQLRASGVILTSEVISCAVIPAPPEIAARLALDAETPVIELVRRRLIETRPVMVVTAYLRYDLCPDLIHDDLSGSLYHLLTGKYHIPVLRAIDCLEAVPADATRAAQLNVSRRFPLMYVDRTAFTTGDQVLHLGLSHIRGDMCRFRTEMRSQSPALELKRPDTFDQTEENYA